MRVRRGEKEVEIKGMGEDEVLSFSPFFHRFDGFCCNIDFFQNAEK